MNEIQQPITRKEDIPADLPDAAKQLIAAALDGTVKLVALVRDKDGKPKFDDPHNVPDVIMDMLTDDDKAYLETLKGN